MNTLTIIPIIFLVLIIVLFIWVIIFMKALKKDKKRLTTLFSDYQNTFNQEELYLEMAESYEDKGDKDKALEYYYLYLRKFPNDAKKMFHVGNLLSATSSETAKEYWERSASLGYEPAIEKLKSLKQ